MCEKSLVNNVTEQIIAALLPNSVVCIVLIGSYSRGTFKPNSDIDLIVVSDCYSSINGYIRNKLISADILSKTKIDLICLTTDEYERYKSSDAFQSETPVVVYKGEHYDERLGRVY